MRISEFIMFENVQEKNIGLQPQRTSFPCRDVFSGKRTGKFLDSGSFAAVVANAPLVAIDLIVKDLQGQALFGLRKNPPAQEYWFVPGGRVYKNETLAGAFARIAYDELGLNVDRTQSRFIGVFEHFYDTNFLGEKGKDTHYVVLAHSILAVPDLLRMPRRQHAEYAWVHENEIQQHSDIHPYAKAYFNKG